jgi:hypothetical protein
VFCHFWGDFGGKIISQGFGSFSIDLTYRLVQSGFKNVVKAFVPDTGSVFRNITGSKLAAREPLKQFRAADICCITAGDLGLVPE